MSGRNIKVPGHALKPVDPNNSHRWECYCGAYGTVLPGSSRRDEHDAHKIAVLRSRGELEDDDA